MAIYIGLELLIALSFQSKKEKELLVVTNLPS